MISASEALTRLKEGNQRYVAGQQNIGAAGQQQRRAELAAGQEPFAIVLGCSDSRVPEEIVFDQGLGDLFVVRIAGNIVTPSQLGSIEFAVEAFGSSLVVVLGYSNCGAVKATLAHIREPSQGLSANLKAAVSTIRPAVEHVLEMHADLSEPELLEQAIQENVRAAVKELSTTSSVLAEKIQKGEVMVVGAEYALETGEVTFF